jgi:5-methyltetrahydropteroyltriglutamate--homocysteine methyltransferase
MASVDRILTTHVGSLVRPDDFAALLRRKVAGGLPDDEFEPALRDAVQEVVRKQVEVGIDVVSDGEFGKIGGWEQYVLARLTGFGAPIAPPTQDGLQTGDMQRFADFYREFWPTQEHPEQVYPCIGEISYVGHRELRRDIDNLKSAMAAAGAKAGFLPVAAPASAFSLSPNEYYPSDEEYVAAGARALREEYVGVTDAGLFVQIDDAHLPFMWDRIVPDGTRAQYFAWARPRIDALKEALRGIPEEKVRYHICWGSWNGPHASDVPLKEIVDLLLELPVGAYAIEAANARHEHEWKVWQDVKLPEGRKLIPGVISHQTNVVEHPELVADRLMRFASVVGRENVMGGSDCGFAQGPFIRRVHPSIMWAKLESLVEGARLATKELWGKVPA